MTYRINQLQEKTRELARDCGIKSAEWQSLLDDIEPLKSHAPDMYAHSLRVGIYAFGLAMREELDAKLALHGGCAHDIGKCAVPDDILHAKDFGPSEKEIVKIHPFAGFDMLKDHHLFSAFIAGLHHEFQDDPYGVDIREVSPWPLSDETVDKVTLMARLVATADFYDALTTRSGQNGQQPGFENCAQRLFQKYGDSPRVSWLLRNDLYVNDD